MIHVIRPKSYYTFESIGRLRRPATLRPSPITLTLTRDSNQNGTLPSFQHCDICFCDVYVSAIIDPCNLHAFLECQSCLHMKYIRSLNEHYQTLPDNNITLKPDLSSTSYSRIKYISSMNTTTRIRWPPGKSHSQCPIVVDTLMVRIKHLSESPNLRIILRVYKCPRRHSKFTCNPLFRVDNSPIIFSTSLILDLNYTTPDNQQFKSSFCSRSYFGGFQLNMTFILSYPLS